ncbi:MAG: MobC family plasmid mobilization relaxosome protein [Desulfovibrio sp.]|jgi:hypothetical protein|nr:MobC family plasmid mobilization relaxosome protein [Desulfovibrio sp.]
MEKKLLRQMARIGANINQLAKWANTWAVETVEVLTDLAGLERRIMGFMPPSMAESGTEDELCSYFQYISAY